mmetsp:Transcript_22053/g.46701  ORF Transcript_22053/g.46701 Transcript_22053/m.46701 type:complete len:809 (-) Transcript_22053:456-2882(-)
MGESALYVLKGIEDMLQTEVKYFSMVRRDGERMYICLGKRALFLIDFEPPFQDFFYYAWVQRVIIDSSNLLLFQVDFSDGREPLILESFERGCLCDELSICWKADFMFRNWRWQPFPLKKGHCNVTRQDRTANEFTVAPERMQRVELRDYMLFIDDAFISDPPGPDGLPTGHYRSANRSRELVVIINPAASVAQLGRREKDNLRLAAEKMARSQTVDGEMILIRSEQYHKRMNLMGDIACYGCWAVHMRTPTLDVGVVACRRKFIPPVGDQYQDVFIVVRDEIAVHEDPISFMMSVERQADSISPLVRVPFYDDTIARVKADALLYDEDSFSWFHSEGIMSVNVDAARAFYKSVAHMLSREMDAQDLPFNIEEVEPDTVLIEDPFRIIGTLWDDAPGLQENSEPEAWRNWRRRVARYLYWTVDGGLHPGEITLELLIKCEKSPSTTPVVRDVLQRLFDFFVHMSSEQVHYELESAALGDKVADHEFMQAFTMNKRPLLVLLERGYIQRTLEDEHPPKYIPFLALMLQRPFEETGTELLVAVCTQIALMSQIEMNREKLLAEHVLLPLIELLRSDDDVLLLAVAKALINLSSGNVAAKQTIVNEGGVRALVPHLLNKTEELTRAFCVLLKNCLTAAELRERIVNDGAVPPLIKLLHKTEIPDAHRSDSVVAAAAAAVWNLSAHDGVKNLVIKERGIDALVMQLHDSENEEVWHKCAGCLMVLAANSEKVKMMVGEQGGIAALSQIIRRSDRNKAVLKACLGALAVLSSDENNLNKLRADDLDLDRFAKDKDERLIMFVKQLLERLYGES